MAKILFIMFVFCLILNSSKSYSDTFAENLPSIEKELQGAIGVYAIDTNNSRIISYRATQKFPVQSTVKFVAAAALLKTVEKKRLLNTVNYSKTDLNYWHPITGLHLKDGMSLAALAEAAISYSDNTAANLIIKQLGGPYTLTKFARAMGNASFNVSHYEGSLNSAPNNSQDTSTPKDMALTVKKILLGNILSTIQKKQLIEWMKNNTVSYKKIRAGAPLGWSVADKTGSGDYGIANDIGILWSPTCKPIILAIYTIRNRKDAKPREDIVALVTHMVMEKFSKNNPCFEKLTS